MSFCDPSELVHAAQSLPSRLSGCGKASLAGAVAQLAQSNQHRPSLRSGWDSRSNSARVQLPLRHLWWHSAT
jgi:hypothetical protein